MAALKEITVGPSAADLMYHSATGASVPRIGIETTCRRCASVCVRIPPGDPGP